MDLVLSAAGEKLKLCEVKIGKKKEVDIVRSLPKID